VAHKSASRIALPEAVAHKPAICIALPEAVAHGMRAAGERRWKRLGTTNDRYFAVDERKRTELLDSALNQLLVPFCQIQWIVETV
jgi:hypothetical protein